MVIVRGKSVGSRHCHREPQGRRGRPYRGGIEVVAVDPGQAETAIAAWRHFGKGRHAAGLNYGDCFADALAKIRRLPLLYRGNVFSQTDTDRVPVP
jgi:uncharacterized protein with PIN domain